MTICMVATSVFLREPKLLVNVERGSSSKYLYVLSGKISSLSFHIEAACIVNPSGFISGKSFFGMIFTSASG